MRLDKLDRKLVQDVLRPLQDEDTSVIHLFGFVWIFCRELVVVLLYLGDVAGAGETKRHRADGLGHQSHGDLIPTIPHCLDGLADIPVVMSHADVL